MPDNPRARAPTAAFISRLPFFYGWIVLAAGTVGVLVSIPGQTIGVSVFTDFLLDGLGLERLQLSLAYFLGTLTGGALLSLAGKLYDRWGARAMGVSASLTLGAVLLAVSQLGAASGAAAAVATMSLVFFVLRFAAWGVLAMVSRNMVMKWFDRRRGLAHALLAVATSVGFSYAARLIDGFIASWGWRGAFKMLALICGGLFTAFALLTFREEPGRYGLVADGKLHGAPRRAATIQTRPDRDYTLPEAMRTRVFWIHALTLALSALVMTALTFHVVSIFEYAGLGRREAVRVFLPLSLVGVGIQALGSYLSDFTKLKHYCLLQHFGLLLASLGLFVLAPGWPKALLILGWGITHAMFGMNVSLPWPRYFGLSHLGSINGFAMACTTVGSAAGPYAYSLLLRLGHGYNAAAAFSFLAAAALLVFSALGYDRDY